MKELYKFCQVRLFFLPLLLSVPTLLFSQRTLTPRPDTVIDQYIHGFYESLPASYGTGTKTYPLLLFMHGAGELGGGTLRELLPLLNTGPQKQINLQVNQGANAYFPDPVIVNGKSYEFIVLVPELNTWPPDGQEQLAVNDMLNYAIKNYRVDTAKMYLTGLSMGGGISWEYAGYAAPLYAKRLAALVPVAGASIPYDQRAVDMAAVHLPVWATHYGVDAFVSTDFTTGYVRMLNNADANPAPLITIYNKTGHGGWRETYGDVGLPGCVNGKGQNVYQWMLQYRREGDSVVLETNSKPPTSVFSVDAGPNIAIVWPMDTVQLTAVATLQNEAIGTINWSQQTGPSLANIKGKDTLTPIMRGLRKGTYVFQVALVSKSGKYRSSQIMVTVDSAMNGTFAAYAGPDVSITLPTNSWKIAGQALTNGTTMASSNWIQVTGPSTATITGGNTTTPTVSDLLVGTYVFRMNLLSTAGIHSSSLMQLKVNPNPIPTDTTPVVVITNPDSSISGLKIYPNPVQTSQELTVEAHGWPKGTINFMVYDGIGRLVRQVVLENNASSFKQAIPMTALMRGSYILAIIMDGQKPKVFKFVVR
jgi:hypothetical protein